MAFSQTATGTVADRSISSPLTADLRRVSWGAILAGVVVALALHVLLSMLGAGVGLATVQPTQAGDTPSATTIGLGAAIWWAVSGIITAFIGGWVAARLAGIPSRGAGTLHGLASWAATILVVLYMLSSTATSAVGGAFSLLGQTMSGLGQAAGGAASSAAQALGNPLDQIIGEVQSAANPNDPQAAGQQLASSVRRMLTSEGDAATEARQSAVDLMVRQGVPPDEAQRRVDQWQQQFTETTQQAEEQARAAAEATAKGVSTAAFYGFVALLLGAIAGALGGRTGTPSLEVARVAVDRRETAGR
jgi:ElaB/YqjD/DUF883 family membrane-anchored ribosome-binding protein